MRDGAMDIFISIHAPLTGSDIMEAGRICIGFDFNPRSPYGERRYASAYRLATPVFQSTLPLRGATARLHKILLRFLFK